MTYLRIILSHWMIILVVAIVTAGAAVGLSFVPTQLYSSEVSLLIIQKQDQYVDPYTSQKAAEKLGQNLVSVIGTFDFMNRVLATGTVSPDLFSSSTEARKKQWQKIVSAEMIAETGVLHVTTYGPSAGEAEDIVLAVSTVLTSNSADYYGSDGVQIKQIDGPVTSERPVKPNIPLNGAMAGLLAAVVVSAFFIVREETQRQAQLPTLQYTSVPQMMPQPNQELYPMPKVEYKVLDEYPKQPYVYGAELRDEPTIPSDEPVGMEDHLK
jgi:capsular polysaccharide biosynthesis protein